MGYHSFVYIYQPETTDSAPDRLKSLPNRVVEGGIPHTDERALEEIEQRLPLPVTHLPFDTDGFNKYLTQFPYRTMFPGYYEGNTTEKAFEHFLSLELLQPSAGDTLIDIAAEGSPLRYIAPHYGCQYFAQDIMYPPGLNGQQIGGDAAQMPVPDAFATMACVTCSIEHFEGDSDMRTIRELGRVLRPGGRFIIIPLYLWTYAAVQTDPTYPEVSFDADAVIHTTPGWRNRHARFYSPETLAKRVLSCDAFRFTLYRITGAPQSVYARWVLAGERQQNSE